MATRWAALLAVALLVASTIACAAGKGEVIEVTGLEGRRPPHLHLYHISTEKRVHELFAEQLGRPVRPRNATWGDRLGLKAKALIGRRLSASPSEVRAACVALLDTFEAYPDAVLDWASIAEASLTDKDHLAAWLLKDAGIAGSPSQLEKLGLQLAWELRQQMAESADLFEQYTEEALKRVLADNFELFSIHPASAALKTFQSMGYPLEFGASQRSPRLGQLYRASLGRGSISGSPAGANPRLVGELARFVVWPALRMVAQAVLAKAAIDSRPMVDESCQNLSFAEATVISRLERSRFPRYCRTRVAARLALDAVSADELVDFLVREWAARAQPGSVVSGSVSAPIVS